MIVEICFIFFALRSLQLTNGAATKTNNDSTIEFFGPTQDVSIRIGTADVPEECKEKNFCTVKPDDYPQELFNKLLKGKFKEQPFQPTYVMADNRLGENSGGMDNCDSTVTFGPLYKVKTNEGVWRTVVQAPEENYVQMVRLETCNKPGSSCFTEFKLPLEIETLCVQKVAACEFLVHDGKDGTEKVKVDLPTCCSCRYKKSEL